MTSYLYDLYKGIYGYMHGSNFSMPLSIQHHNSPTMQSVRPTIQTPDDGSGNVILEEVSSSEYVIMSPPAFFYLKESDMMERADIYKILSQNKHFRVLRFLVCKNYSCYLFCYWILDLMDILSNELFFLESRVEIFFDQQFSQSELINELKTFLRKKIPYLQHNKVLPIYAKFLVDPDVHIEYSITFGTRFHILFIKEEIDHLLIQRLHFHIDI